MLVRLRVRPHCMPIYVAPDHVLDVRWRLFIKPFVAFNPHLNFIFYEASQQEAEHQRQ